MKPEQEIPQHLEAVVKYSQYATFDAFEVISQTLLEDGAGGYDHIHPEWMPYLGAQ
jgi:hypothetical protein